MNVDDRLDKMDQRLMAIERKQQQIFNLATGIAIGMVVAALIFGIITLKEAKDFIK
jgi:hypothetical protein